MGTGKPEGMNPETRDDWEYCAAVLPRVSRTFALNIRQLEGETYRAVLLGYLLFRIADTFEDNVYQSGLEKITALNDYADIFRENRSLEDRLQRYETLRYRWHEKSPDKELVESGDRAIRCYFTLPEKYREVMDPCIARTSKGMAKFQQEKLASNSRIFQLKDIGDLQGYCYYVAGVVGVMLTGIFCEQASLSRYKPELEKHQVKFGAALQLTNIAKDYPKDIRRGWCYIPASITEKHGIDPEKLDSLSHSQKKGVFRMLLPVILEAYDSTLKYIETIPESERSIRMFCVIPFVLAYNTLLHVAEMKGDKISREELAILLTDCNSYARSNRLLEEDYLKAARRLENSLSDIGRKD